MLLQALIVAVLVIIILLISLSVHEFAHAAVAYLFGDDTAKRYGRLSLNPLRHWDRVGTTLLVGLLLLNALGLVLPVFGWGKPVPVDESNFENPKFHGLQTALAGPMSNFILAVLLGIIIRFTHLPLMVEGALILAVHINLFLMFFNLIPVPPLDGSRVLRLFLPEQLYFQLATNPFFFYIFFFFAIYVLAAPLQQLTGQLATFLIGR